MTNFTYFLLSLIEVNTVLGQWGSAGKKRGFTFSLPGQWGNGQNKRSPPFMSFKQECEAADVDTLQTTFEFLKVWQPSLLCYFYTNDECIYLVIFLCCNLESASYRDRAKVYVITSTKEVLNS